MSTLAASLAVALSLSLGVTTTPPPTTPPTTPTPTPTPTMLTPTTLTPTIPATPPPTPNLAAGRYRLEVVATARASMPLIGASTTFTVSLVDLDADGGATQQVCSIETRGRGYLARPLPAALAALPAQRYRFNVDGDVVRADPGPLHLGKVRPLPMEVVVSGVGRFVVEVESVNHAVLDGARNDRGAAGLVVVKTNHQTIKKGLPFAVDGDTVIDKASFSLVRVDDQQACK